MPVVFTFYIIIIFIRKINLFYIFTGRCLMENKPKIDLSEDDKKYSKNNEEITKLVEDLKTGLKSMFKSSDKNKPNL